MTIFLSPAVLTSESDQTLFVREKSNKVGAIAGGFQWGPVDVPTLISNGEEEFVTKFGIPNAATFKYVMPMIDFLSYSQAAWVVRQVGPLARNAFATGGTAALIKNDDDFAAASITGADFIAKYPGTVGNGTIVDICNAANFDTWEFNNRFSYKPLTGEYAIAVVDTTGHWTGSGSKKQKEKLVVTGTATAAVNITVFGISVATTVGQTAASVAAAINAAVGFSALFSTTSVYTSEITYTSLTTGKNSVRTAPSTQNGLSFTTQIIESGSLGTVLEAYEIMEDVATAKNTDGTTKYWADAINQRSKYVRAADKSVALSDRTVVLTGGVDDYAINLTSGYQQLSNTEAYDVQFLISPDVSAAEQKAIIAVADTRGDCMAFVSPAQTDVVNNKGGEVEDVNIWRINTLNMDSSYAFAIDNWGYMYDKYNDVYRWIPATGGTAGIFARSFEQYDPWISPAGHQRGKFKNYTKMAWSATQSERDSLYKTGINSIVTFPAQGIVLFGDKTMTQRPSAFGHVNVRWAFIVAKVSLADMAKYFLFEINDEFTRAQFVNAARPFLRTMKGRRAFEDFQVICNANNNDGEVRLQNKMVVQVLLKPTYSINWVVLNLAAIRPDVAFTESSN